MRLKFLGVPIDNLDMDETLAKAEALIRSGVPHQHAVVNVNKIVKADKDPRLKEVIAGCDLVNIDGMPLVWASRLFGFKIKARVTGIDLFVNLLALAEQRGYRPYFLGAAPEVLDAMLNAVKKAHPDLQIAGSHHGYWTVAEEPGLVERIRTTQPDVLFLAIPSPQKEFWLNRHLHALNVPFAMGVGGSFDVLAGKTRRAPRWMQQASLEWFYRFVQEPRRLFSRYFLEGCHFLVLLVKYRLAYTGPNPVAPQPRRNRLNKDRTRKGQAE